MSTQPPTQPGFRPEDTALDLTSPRFNEPASPPSTVSASEQDHDANPLSDDPNEKESLTTALSHPEHYLLPRATTPAPAPDPQSPSPASLGSVALLAGGVVLVSRVTLLTIQALPRVIFLNPLAKSLVTLLSLSLPAPPRQPTPSPNPDTTGGMRIRVHAPRRRYDELSSELYSSSSESSEEESGSEVFEDARTCYGGEDGDEVVWEPDWEEQEWERVIEAWLARVRE